MNYQDGALRLNRYRKGVWKSLTREILAGEDTKLAARVSFKLASNTSCSTVAEPGVILIKFL